MNNDEKKLGFTYMYSTTLSQDVAIQNKTGILFCRDGTTYTPEELNKINVSGVEIPLSVHIVKKFFGGTLSKIQ